MKNQETFEEMMEGGKFFINVSVDNDKYRVRIRENEDGTLGPLHVLRYGAHWKDCIGDNLIYWLALELQEARIKIKEADILAETAAEAVAIFAECDDNDPRGKDLLNAIKNYESLN